MTPEQVIERVKEAYSTLDWTFWDDLYAVEANLKWMTLRVQPSFVNGEWLQVRIELVLPSSDRLSKAIHGTRQPHLVFFDKWHNDTIVARPEFVRKGVDRLLDEPRRYLERLRDSASVVPTE